MIIFRKEIYSDMRAAPDFESIITITVIYWPTKLGRLFKVKPKEKVTEYMGDCTVWHKLPNHTRCGTMTEGWLHGIWRRHKHSRN